MSAQESRGPAEPNAQAWLAALVEQSPDAILSRRLDGTITSWNRGAEQLFGYAAREAVGRHITMLMPEDCRGGWERTRDALLRGESMQFDDTVWLHKDGRAVSVWINIFPVHDGRGEVAGVSTIARDITARKQAEAELRESRERLALAQEVGGIGSWDWDLVKGELRWSAEMFRLTGIDPATPADRLYAAWLAMLHPGDRQETDRDLRRYMRQGGAYSSERRILCPDGSVRWLLSRGRALANESGRPVRMLGVALDITERKRMEEALRESEQRFRDIAANFPGIIFRRITYPDGRIEYPYISENAERLFGVSPEIKASLTSVEALSRFFSDADMQRWREETQRAADTEVPLELEARVFAPDGKERWVRSLSRPRKRADGAVVFDGINLDITAQKQAEHALRRSEERLREAQAIAELGRWEYDIATGAINWSEQVYRIFGRDPEAGEPGLEELRALLHPEDRPVFAALLEAAVTKAEGFETEWRIRRPDGSYRWKRTRARVFTDDAGQPVRLVGTDLDITERKQAEEHQKLLMAEIDHRAKNLLAVVQSIAQQSIKDRAALEKFCGRLSALANAHNLLAASRWEGASLAAIVRDALAAYAEPVRRVSLSGPDLQLEPQLAQTLSLALHELATNAAKYGALSVPQGRIAVRWQKRVRDGGAHLLLEWQESDGPPLPSRPKRSGFGTVLIERVLTYEQDGDARLEFRPEGLRAYMDLPLGTQLRRQRQEEPPLDRRARS